jgi:MoaA/NifB/PqqE/SkfB family radical SAM enzyme
MAIAGGMLVTLSGRLYDKMGPRPLLVTGFTLLMINTWQEKQRVFAWEGQESEYEEIVKQAETKARRLGIQLSRPSLLPGDVAVCDENPLRNLYISAEGEVSPCVYLYPALPSPFRRIFRGREYWVEKVSFGNIFKDPISVIWSRSNYERFRN